MVFIVRYEWVLGNWGPPVGIWGIGDGGLGEESRGRKILLTTDN
jgi:hypothetical protein